MARLVHANGSLLYRPDGSFVTDVGGAPCCCGGLTPCGCTGAAGCDARTGFTVFSRTKSLRSGPVFNYSYGPVPADCCCLRAASSIQIDWEVHGYFPGEGEDFRVVTTATGDGSQITSRQIVSQSQTPGGPLVVVCDRTSVLPNTTPCVWDVQYSGPCSYGILQSLSPEVFWPFGGSLDSRGWDRATCDSYEGYQEQIIYPNQGSTPFVVRRIQWRFSISTDRASCVTPTCRTCCLPGPICILTNPDQCRAAGGIPGDDQDCANAHCLTQIEPGVCCMPDGTCRKIGNIGCAVSGGVWQPGQTCDTVICPVRRQACCLFAGGCAERTAAECAGIGDWYPTAHCGDPGVCPPPVLGACCQGTVCSQQSEGQCVGNDGRWQGPGTPCLPATCSCLGACCSSVGGSHRQCSIETEANCLTLAFPTWNGCGSLCEGRDCTINPSGLILPPPRTLIVPSGCTGCGGGGSRGLTI